MGSGWIDALAQEAKKIVSERYAEAVSRAQYKVQVDFHTKAIKHIAKQTGHVNLAQACYFMLRPSGIDIDAEIFYDASAIYGFYKSHSSFHKSGGAWRVVESNKDLANYDFWEMHYNGETGGSYGQVEEEWIMENFWNGRKYVTNGWPLNKNAEYLSGHYVETVSAYDVAQGFIDDYIAAGYYERYIQAEL